MSTDERYPVNAPGWAALDRLLAVIYPGQTPHQFTSSTAYDLESTAPLPAISVFEGTAPDHFHYVTYGLTELFEKTSQNADISGFGFELTFRLPRTATDESPPTWPLRLLQGIGHYILTDHAPLDTGHCIDLGTPLIPGADCALTGVVCVPDPQLSKVDTPHGSVLFLQLFGLTGPELERVREWDLPRKVGLVTDASPQGVTDPARGPFLEDPRLAPVFRRYDLNIRL